VKNKKYLIIFLLIILVSISGCVELITTQEKQACLALTHFSSTSIEGCLTQKSCYAQVDSIGYYSSKYLPYSIHNTLLAYQNHIASSYFYYTKTTKLLDKINRACQSNKPKEILDNLNLSRFYFAESFKYIDKTSKESINLITAYAIYLEKQEINLIPEELLYDDYILLNQNLNDLKEIKNSTSYISKLNTEIKNLYDYAKEIGFRSNYIKKENISDLSAYYLEIYEEETNSFEVNIPELFGIGYFALNTASNIMDLKRINTLANKLDVYNYYLLTDKFIGKENSLAIELKNINNSLNENLDEVFAKIKILEEEIEIDENYLSDNSKTQYYINKNNFAESKTSFGAYLSSLKTIKNEISKNKLNEDTQNNVNSINMLECDLIIDYAKEYTSIYFKTKINDYQKTNNLIKKMKFCEDINKALNNPECNKQLEFFLKTNEAETKDFELLMIDDNKQCVEVVGNINYILTTNEKITLLSELIKTENIKIKEINIFSQNYIVKSDLIKIHTYLTKLQDQKNIEKIIDIDSKITTLIKNDNLLNELAKQIIKNNLDYIHINQNNLIIKNPFSFKLETITLSNPYTQITSNNNKLKITSTKIQLEILFSGENYFNINYLNEKKITYYLKYLGIDDAIVEIDIENTVEGIKDEITFLPEFKTTDPNIFLEDNVIKYTTKKNNKIYLTGTIFETLKQIYIEELTLDKFIIIEKYTLKNLFPKDINQKLNLMNYKEDELAIIFENNKEINPIIEGDKIKINLTLKQDKTTQINLQKMCAKSKVYNELDNYLLEIQKLNLSVFENIKKEVQANFTLEISFNLNKEYTLNEIKSMYTKIPKLQLIQKKYYLCETAETKYFINYNKIDQNKLSNIEKVKLVNINNNKYKNIIFYEIQLNEFIEEVNNREKKYIKFKFEENITQLESQKELINKYNLTTINIDELIKTTDINNITKIISDNLKLKSDQIYSLIDPITNGLDTRQITELITKVYTLYDDYTLRDLYSLKYYAGITENDAKRLEKNIVFIDGVLLNRELTNFKENYDNQKYAAAIDSISTETINRINKIKADITILEVGLNIIKSDAKTEISNYQKTSYDKEILELAKNNYDNEKYLNTIVLLKNNTKKNDISNKQLKPTLISIVIIILFSGVYIYLRLDKKEKSQNQKNKKKKIIRH